MGRVVLANCSHRDDSLKLSNAVEPNSTDTTPTSPAAACIPSRFSSGLRTTSRRPYAGRRATAARPPTSRPRTGRLGRRRCRRRRPRPPPAAPPHEEPQTHRVEVDRNRRVDQLEPDEGEQEQRRRPESEPRRVGHEAGAVVGARGRADAAMEPTQRIAQSVDRTEQERGRNQADPEQTNTTPNVGFTRCRAPKNAAIVIQAVNSSAMTTTIACVIRDSTMRTNHGPSAARSRRRGTLAPARPAQARRTRRAGRRRRRHRRSCAGIGRSLGPPTPCARTSRAQRRGSARLEAQLTSSFRIVTSRPCDSTSIVPGVSTEKVNFFSSSPAATSNSCSGSEWTWISSSTSRGHHEGDLLARRRLDDLADRLDLAVLLGDVDGHGRGRRSRRCPTSRPSRP